MTYISGNVNKGAKIGGTVVVDFEDLNEYKQKNEKLTQEISLLRQNHKDLIESLEAGFKEELAK